MRIETSEMSGEITIDFSGSAAGENRRRLAMRPDWLEESCHPSSMALTDAQGATADQSQGRAATLRPPEPPRLSNGWIDCGLQEVEEKSLRCSIRVKVSFWNNKSQSQILPNGNDAVEEVHTICRDSSPSFASRPGSASSLPKFSSHNFNFACAVATNRRPTSIGGS